MILLLTAPMQSVAVVANPSVVLHENGQQRAEKSEGQMKLLSFKNSSVLQFALHCFFKMFC